MTSWVLAVVCPKLERSIALIKAPEIPGTARSNRDNRAGAARTTSGSAPVGVGLGRAEASKHSEHSPNDWPTRPREQQQHGAEAEPAPNDNLTQLNGAQLPIQSSTEDSNDYEDVDAADEIATVIDDLRAMLHAGTVLLVHEAAAASLQSGLPEAFCVLAPVLRHFNNAHTRARR